MITFDSLTPWITAFFVLAGLATVLCVLGFAMVLRPRAEPVEAQPAPIARSKHVLEGADTGR